jgi:ATP-dependent Clp protease ATP-binding subunit ClpA
METLHGHFKPEFLNRVDDIIIFIRWAEQLVKIVELRLKICVVCWPIARFRS